MPLLLTENDVRQLLTMDLAIEAVEEMFRKGGQNVPRARCQTDQAMLHVMAAASSSLGVLGYKAYTTTRRGAQFHVALFDGTTGALETLIQADYLGQVRTGAASGVATRALARPDAATVGVLGAGKQARTQLWAVSRVRRLRHVFVYSPSEDRRLRFAEEMTAMCQCSVEPASSPELAARDRDIVITATSARKPVLQGDWLAEGTHLNVIGSNFLTKAEIDVATIRRCRAIVVDNLEQARLEAGDFVEALQSQALVWADVHELSDLLLGRVPGRRQPEDVTLFKSVGIALEDIAVGVRVAALARTAQVGQHFDW